MCLTRLHLSEVTASSPVTLTGEARRQRCIVNPQTAALNTKQPDNLPWLSTLHSIFTVFFFRLKKTKQKNTVPHCPLVASCLTCNFLRACKMEVKEVFHI